MGVEVIIEDKSRQLYVDPGKLSEEQRKRIDELEEVAKQFDAPLRDEVWQVGGCHFFGRGYFIMFYTNDEDNKFNMRGFLAEYLGIDDGLILEEKDIAF